MDKHQFPRLPAPRKAIQLNPESGNISVWSAAFFFVCTLAPRMLPISFWGTAIRPQNMTGSSSTKRMNEFAMKRTRERERERAGERERWGRAGILSLFLCHSHHAVRCFVRVCGKYQNWKRTRQGRAGGRLGDCSRALCSALYVFMLNVIIRRTATKVSTRYKVATLDMLHKCKHHASYLNLNSSCSHSFS